MSKQNPASIQNLVPLPYRHVSVQPYDGPMTAEAVRAHLLGRDSYRRTRYVVLEKGDQCAVAAVGRESEEPLFSDITQVEILALPDTCVLVEDDEVDPGNRTALAAKASEVGLGSEVTLVVRGMDQHVNFIHRPKPIKIRVVDVTPPHPSKLLRMARKVLSYADLPPIQLVSENIELGELAATAPDAEAYLIPCRASGLNLDRPTYFLDQRPSREDWTMIACERSRQIHEHFYGDEAPRIEMCPRKLAQEDGSPTLVKCCELEDNIELDGEWAIVPWGANLGQVEDALKALVMKKEG
jgi:hypothetical protein